MGVAQSDSGSVVVVYFGLSDAFRDGLSKEGFRIVELTRVGGVQPLLSESQRTERFKSRTRTIPRLLQEVDSDQNWVESTSLPHLNLELYSIGNGVSVDKTRWSQPKWHVHLPKSCTPYSHHDHP